MPIRPEMRRWYGEAHRKRAHAAKVAAGWKCQRCGEPHGKLYEREDGSYYRVTLTLAHLNHKPWDNRAKNLAVLCPGCHLEHDRPEHLKRAAATRARKAKEAFARAGQLQLV